MLPSSARVPFPQLLNGGSRTCWCALSCSCTCSHTLQASVGLLLAEPSNCKDNISERLTGGRGVLQDTQGYGTDTTVRRRTRRQPKAAKQRVASPRPLCQQPGCPPNPARPLQTAGCRPGVAPPRPCPGPVRARAWPKPARQRGSCRLLVAPPRGTCAQRPGPPSAGAASCSR